MLFLIFEFCEEVEEGAFDGGFMLYLIFVVE